MTEQKFNAVATRDKLVEMIREYVGRFGIQRVVLGVSGGKDSTVAAALCARALGRENVYGIMLPDGEQKDISDSMAVCAALGINGRTVNIGKIHAALNEAALAGCREDILPGGVDATPAERESAINVPPRLRMTTLRYIAQALGAFLCGTGNLSEGTVGYCTKDGDTSCDFNPLGALTSVEVVQVGLTMPELPEKLVRKTPNDGLSGVSDEVKLGLTYQQIHDYIRSGTCGDADVDARIHAKWLASAHKRRPPVVLNPLTGQVQ